MSFLKGAIIFTSGVVVGGTASYFYFRKKTNDREQELEELKEHYLGKIAEEAEKEHDTRVVEKIIKKEKYIPYELPKPVRVTEEKVVKSHPDEAFVIDEIEYSERELYFDKIELDYYVEDEVLVDEAEEITDINTTVGYDIIDDFIKDESEDVIYVRNSKMNTDYMINKRFGKYSDIVGLGGDDNDE